MGMILELELATATSIVSLHSQPNKTTYLQIQIIFSQFVEEISKEVPTRVGGINSQVLIWRSTVEGRSTSNQNTRSLT